MSAVRREIPGCVQYKASRLRQDADGTLFVSEKKERKLSVPGGKAGLFPEDAYTSKE